MGSLWPGSENQRLLAAAARLKDVPKDDRGGPQGDPESKGAIFWFTALLKDPKTQLPDLSHFLASSYDPRWMGKVVEVRGTVSRVEVDTSGSPRYATIHFKESKNDRFTAFTPNSEILESYGQNFSGLVGKPIEIWGQVQDWREGAGVRFLIGETVEGAGCGRAREFPGIRTGLDEDAHARPGTRRFTEIPRLEEIPARFEGQL